MQLYTIAKKCNACYGHGDFGTELRIVKDGGYGEGDFPPIFPSEISANLYKSHRGWGENYVVVPLTLNEERT